MKKQRIELRGVILDASWDDEWLDSYIQKGIFTPESRVRSQLKAAADAGDEVELYISSQGGSCIAGNEILAAFAGFQGAKSIVVGSFAASMAANIVLQANVPVKAHNNSLFLFHGAFGLTLGGKGAHEDAAAILARINAPIMAALKAKGVPDKRIEEGFAEGRELTMTAAEAKQYGIVAEIIDEPAPLVARLDKEEEEEILAKGSELPIAACAAWQSVDLDALSHAAIPSSGQSGNAATPPPPPPAPNATAGQSLDVATLSDRLVAVEAQRRDLQSQRDKLAAQLDTERKDFATAKQALEGSVSTLTQANKDLESRIARMALNALGSPTGGCAQSWPEALEECGGYEGAAKKYPHLAEAYRTQHAKA